MATLILNMDISAWHRYFRMKQKSGRTAPTALI